MDMQNILTVAQLAEENPAFPESSIRWWIFNADRNGFDRCIIRIGQRVYIDRKAFEDWLEAHRERDWHGSEDGGHPPIK